MSATPFEFSRNLGEGEYMWWQMSKTCPVHFCFTFRVVGKLNAEAFKAALIQVQNRHHLLRARVAEAKPLPKLQVAKQAGLPLEWVSDAQDQDFEEQVRLDLATPIPLDSEVLWRIKVLESQSHTNVLIAMHHAFFDGKAATVLIHEALLAYSGKDLPKVNPQECFSADQLLPKVPWSTKFISRVRGLAATLKSTPVTKLNEDPAHAGQDTHTHFMWHEFDQQQTKLMLKRCKERGTSINELLGGALAKSLIPIIGEEKQQVAMSVAINIRPLLGKAHTENLGYFSSGANSVLELSADKTAVELGAKVMSDVKAQYTLTQAHFGVWLRKLVTRLKPDPFKLMDTVKRAHKANVHLTNMGLSGIETHYGAVEVDRVVAVVSVHYTQKPVFCQYSITHNGKLAVVASFCQPHTTAHRATTMYHAALAELHAWLES